MAAPSVRSVGTVANGVGNVTPALPTGHALNDILIIVCETLVAEIPGTPTDYANVLNSPTDTTGGGTGPSRLTVFWKRHDGSEVDPTLTDAGDHIIARMIAVQGCITTGNPWDVGSVTTTAAAATSRTIPGAVTTVADCLVLVAISAGIVETFSSWANADLGSVTDRINNSTTDGNDGSIGLITGTKATAGTYGNTTVTLSASSKSQGLTLALKPASGDATASPGVIACTATLPAVTKSAGTTVAPAAIASVSTLPAAAKSVSHTVVPAAIASLTTLPAATKSAGTTSSPAVLASLATLPAAAKSVSHNFTPASIASVATLPAATATGGGTGATALPEVIALTATLPAGSASGGATALPAAIVTVSTLPSLTATAGAGATASPAVIMGIAALPAASASAGTAVTPATLALVVAMGGVTVTTVVAPQLGFATISTSPRGDGTSTSVSVGDGADSQIQPGATTSTSALGDATSETGV